MRRPLVFVIFVVSSLVFAAIAVFGWTAVREESARPKESTQLTLRFEGVTDARAMQDATRILRERLRAAGASDVRIESRGTDQLLLEYRPLAPSETHATAEELSTCRGRLRFLVSAEAGDFVALGSTSEDEHQKLEDWRAKHPDTSCASFLDVEPAAGGPVRGLIWCALRHDESVRSAEERIIPLVEPKAAWRFGSADLGHVGVTSDDTGERAITFEMKRERDRAFGDFTESIRGRGMAIVVDDQIVTLATVNGRLSGSSMITGGRKGFSPRDLHRMVTVLRSRELPGRPTIVSTTHVPGTSSGRVTIAWVFASVCALLSAVLLVLGVRWLRKPTAGSP